MCNATRTIPTDKVIKEYNAEEGKLYLEENRNDAKAIRIDALIRTALRISDTI